MEYQNTALDKMPTLVDGENKAFKNYCKTCACAGMSDYARARNPLKKVFWAVVVLTGLIVTTWQTYELFSDYFCDIDNRFQTVVSDSKDFKKKPFPRVTVCNFNRVNVSRMLEQELDYNLTSMLLSSIAVSYHIPSDFLTLDAAEMLLSEEYRRFLRLMEERQTDPIQLLDLLGHDCRATLIKASFNGEDIVDPCNITETVITNYGKCFVLTIGRPQIAPGDFGGLKLLINPAAHRYLPLVESNFIEEGIVMQVSYEEESIILEPITIRPGSHAFICLTATEKVYKMAKYPMFSLPCLDNPQHKVVQGDYSKRSCYYDKFMSFMLENAGCVLPIATREKFKFCPLDTRKSMKDQLLLRELSNIYATEEQCLDRCQSTFCLSNMVTTTKFPSEQAMTAFKQFVRTASESRATTTYFDCPRASAGADKCVRDMIAVDIYFSSLDAALTTTTEAQPLFTFISNIGGQLGLWTGMCIITLVQFVYFLIALCLGSVERHQCQTRTAFRITR